MWKMYKQCLTGALLALFCVVSLADEKPTVDELKAELAQLVGQSEARIPVLVELVRACWRLCSVEAEIYAEEALTLFDIYDFPRQEAILLGFYPRIFLDSGDYERAGQLIERGIRAGKKSKDDKALARVLFNQAVMYQNNDLMVLAENTYKQLEEVYERSANYEALGNVYNNLGQIHKKLGNLSNALDYYLKGLPLLEEYGNPGHLANTLMNIGEVYWRSKNSLKAEEFVQRGLALITPEIAPLSWIEGHQRLSYIFTDGSQYTAAIEELLIAEKTAIQHNFRKTQLLIYVTLSENYLFLKDAERARFYVYKAAELLGDSEDIGQHSMVNLAYAEIAMFMENWEDAEMYLERNLTIENMQNRFFDSNEAMVKLLEVKEWLGKSDEALALQKAYISQYKDFIQRSRQSQIEQATQLFENSEKQRQILVLERDLAEKQAAILAEQEARRHSYFFVTFAVMALVIVILIGANRRKALQLEAEMARQLVENKQRLFTDISHELKTPLTVFKLKMEELQYEIAENPADAYQSMHERIDSFNTLIDDIAQLAKADAGELELSGDHVQLSGYFEEFATDLTRLANEHGLSVDIVRKLEGAETGRFDKVRIRQVLNNLMSNSCRYTNSPGKVFFKVRYHRNQLEFRFEDTAPGLSIEECAKVFERLYRADKSRSRQLGGSGLGLTISKLIIEAHGGTITAAPSALGGIRIDVTLPLRPV